MNEIEKSKVEILNTLHAECMEGMRIALYKAVEAGGILQEVKAALPHGQFSKWVEENVSFDIRTAQRYMKAYDNRDLLKNDTVSSLRDLIEGPKEQRHEQPKESPLQKFFDCDKIRVLETGIEFTGLLTEQEWEELLRKASYLDKEKSCTQWIIGDLLKYGNRRTNLIPPEGYKHYFTFGKIEGFIANSNHPGFYFVVYFEPDNFGNLTAVGTKKAINPEMVYNFLQDRFKPNDMNSGAVYQVASEPWTYCEWLYNNYEEWFNMVILGKAAGA